MREELIAQAISFLSDSKVKASSLSKRISFLEGKGLTVEEINESIKRAYPDDTPSIEDQMSKFDNRSTFEKVSSPQKAENVSSSQKLPILPERVTVTLKKSTTSSWTDLLLLGTFCGGISWFLAYYVKNLIKNLSLGWPFFKSESDKIVQEISKIKTSIDEIKNEQAAIKDQIIQQCLSLKTIIDDTREQIDMWSRSEEDSQLQFQTLAESIDSINLLLPQIQNSTNDRLKQSIEEWESQLQSLRTLISTKSEDILSTVIPSKDSAQLVSPSSKIELPSWQADPTLNVIRDIIQ